MKTYKQFLTEVQWQNSFATMILMGSDLGDEKTMIFPLSLPMLKRTLQNIEPDYYFHVAGFQNLDKMIKLQNKRSKGISAFKNLKRPDNLRNLFDYGIHGGKGFLFFLEAEPLLEAAFDVFSMPTNEGLRIVDLVYLRSVTHSKNKKIGELITSIEKRYVPAIYEIAKKHYENILMPVLDLSSLPKESKNNLRELTRTLTQIEDVLYKIKMNKNNSYGPEAIEARGKFRQMLIKDFLDWWNRDIAQNKETYIELMMEIKNYHNALESYDESVVTNIKIKHVFIYTIKEEEENEAKSKLKKSRIPFSSWNDETGDKPGRFQMAVNMMRKFQSTGKV